MKTVKKMWVACLLSSFLSLQSAFDIDQILSLYQNPLNLVESLCVKHARDDYQSIVSLCLYFNKPLAMLIKDLRNDMRIVQCAIKKENLQLQDLYNKLKALCAYLKRHKTIYNAILTHDYIKNLYQSLFNMIDNDQDVVEYIDKHREQFGLHNDDNQYLGNFLKEIKKFSRQISMFEDYVHADYVDLKLQNYVFKIELIKLRNAILFDKRYKK